MSHSAYGLLTKRRFLPLFLTQFFEAFNDNIFKNALIIIITYEMVFSGRATSLLLALLSGLFILPYFLFSSLAGQIADKYDKAKITRVIKVVEICSMLFGSIGLLTSNFTILIMTLGLLGIHSAFFGPIKYAILPQHLHENELIGGNALIESSTFIAILIGTCVGGGLIGLHYGHIIVACMIITFACVGLFTSMFIPTAPSSDPHVRISYRIITDTIQLIRDATADRRIYLAILGISWFWLVGGLFLSQLPSYTKEYLGVNASVATFIVSVCCIGIATGSLLCAKLQKGKITATYVPVSIIGMSVCMTDLYFASHHLVEGSGAALIGFKAFFSSLQHWRVLTDIFLVTLFGGLFTVPLYAIMQSLADPAHRSRIIAGNNVINAIFMVAASIGTMVLLTLHFSIPQIFLLTAIINGVVALISCGLLPDAVVKSFFCWAFNLMYRVKVNGIENYEQAPERILIIANHVSFIDALLLSAYLPERLTFAIHTTFARKWWMKPILMLVDTFPLDPANPMQLKSLVKALKNGKRCMIFPEGRLTVTGSLMKVYEGPALVADKADAHLLPVHIDGANLTPFTRLKGLVRWRFFPKVTMTILPARKLIVQASLTGREKRHHLGEHLYQIMSEIVYASTDTQKSLYDAMLDIGKTRGLDLEIIEDTERKPITYGNLILRSFLLSNHFVYYLKGQKNVGLLMPNMSGTTICLFALYARGFVPAMLNYSTGSKNIISACKSSQIKVVITSQRFITAAKLQSIIDALERHDIRIIYTDEIKANISTWCKVKAFFQALTPRWTYHRLDKEYQNSERPAVILYTSGSEGTPKGVVLSHRNLQANRAQIGARVDFSPRDIIFNALPLFHSFGFSMGFILPLLSGLRQFLYPSPLHYRIVPEMIYDTDATIVFGTDTFLVGYARFAHPYDFYSVRYVFAGAERLRPETKELWANKFGVRIFEGYGATETTPVLSANTPMHNKPGSVGKLLPHIEYKLEAVSGISEGGKLWVKGPNVMLGYLREENPGVLQAPEDGWYDTGDIVTVDEEGYITIQGRAKRFAKIGGEMVSLTAVESYIATIWPDHLNAVISIPCPRKGEQLILFTNNPDADRTIILKAFQENGIAEIFLPKRVSIIDDIPLLGSGKINYNALSERESQKGT